MAVEVEMEMVKEVVVEEVAPEQIPAHLITAAAEFPFLPDLPGKGGTASSLPAR